MPNDQPKKVIILDILHILQKHSDVDHRLSQKHIQNLIKSEYGMEVALQKQMLNIWELRRR